MKPYVLLLILYFGEVKRCGGGVSVCLWNGEFFEGLVDILSCEHMSFGVPHHFLRLLQNFSYFQLQISKQKLRNILINQILLWVVT